MFVQRIHYPGGGGDSTLIRQVCAAGNLNLSPCSGVGKPKKDTLLWSYHFFLNCIVLYCIVLYCIVLYCIVLYCIVLYCSVLYCIVLKTKIMFMLYLFNQMILPFPFSSVMFVQKSFKFFITVISLRYMTYAVLFKINNILPFWITFYMLR